LVTIKEHSYMDEWNLLQSEEPIYGSLVLVWRKRNRKYTIARLEINQSPYEEEKSPYKNLDWVTEHGSTHQANPEDRWMVFKHLRLTEDTIYE